MSPNVANPGSASGEPAAEQPVPAGRAEHVPDDVVFDGDGDIFWYGPM